MSFNLELLGWACLTIAFAAMLLAQILNTK